MHHQEREDCQKKSEKGNPRARLPPKTRGIMAKRGLREGDREIISGRPKNGRKNEVRSPGGPGSESSTV